MTEKTVVVKNTLDARQAAFFVQTASKFASKIELSIAEKKINAKSIMGTISLGVIEGDTVSIIADGTDENQALLELLGVIC